MKKMMQFWVLAIALGVLLTGCHGAKKFGTPGICKPGDTGEEIRCADGTQGFMLCGAKGDAFDGGTTCKSGQQPATGCGSDDAECVPGEAVSCGCNDGREGAQKCNTACNGYDACICTGPVPGTGGQGGSTGGAGGSTGGSGGSTGGSGGSSMVCSPQQAYTCDNECASGSGTKWCRADGLSYGPCECQSATGGSGGSTGGAGGSTGGSGGSSMVCTPQQAYEDKCDNECGDIGGTRWCRQDGLSFGPCECNTASGGSGGSSGTGGSGGSGGSTGGSGGSTGGTGGSTGGAGGSGGSTSYCGTASDACHNVVQQNCNCQVDGNVLSGTQNCKPDCSGWESCYCVGGVGGSGGTGGSGGSGGSGGTSGSGGTGGLSGTAVDVTCEITHADYTAFKFDFTNYVMSSVQHVYSVFVSDEGVDNGNGGATYATATHVKWGDTLNLQQLGRSVKFTFRTTLGSRIKLNAARDPVGSDLSSADYWRDPASSRNPLRPLMKADCTVDVNGSVSHVAWPRAVEEGSYGSNLWFTAQAALTSASDRDGDGSPVGSDCDEDNFYKSPNLVEVMQDGVDNNCFGGDEKYRRVVMEAPSGIMNSGGIMKFWDFNQSSPHGVKLIYDGKWYSAYVPVTLLPYDIKSGLTVKQPGGLVQYPGSGDNCYNGLCRNMSDWGTLCHQVYPVWAETSDGIHVESITARNTNSQCRSFFPNPS